MKQSKPSMRRLLQVDVETSTQLLEGNDQRASAVQEMRSEQEGALDAIRDVFLGTKLQADEKRMRTLVALRGEILESWGQARDAFLHVGRTLNRLDTTLTVDERDRLRQQSTRLFPFSESIASQLRQVAFAVDQGRIPLALLPGSYSVAYQLTLLKPRQMELAQKRGLIRPDITREAIIRFRREMQDASPKKGQTTLSRTKLRTELRRLQAVRRRNLLALVALRRRIQEITSVLEHPGTH